MQHTDFSGGESTSSWSAAEIYQYVALKVFKNRLLYVAENNSHASYALLA